MKWFPVALLGVLAGTLAILLAGTEMRWVIYTCLATVILVAFLATKEKQKLLVFGFIFSLQFDVYLRFLYGRAGSEGLAIPLTGFIGIALVVYIVLHPPCGDRNKLVLAGSQAGPIIALLCTTVFSLLTTNELFVGLTRLNFELTLYLIYWIALNIVHSKEDFERILRLLFLALAIQCTVFFIQSALGITFTLVGETFAETEIPRPGGTVSVNPAGFASFITPPLCIILTVFLIQQNVKAVYIGKHLNTLLLLMGTAAIILTFTRAVWAGYILGLLIILHMNFRLRILNTKRALVLIVAVAIAGLILMPTMLERLTTDYGAESALDERIGLIRIAVRMIEAHPLTGVGPGAYGQVFKDYAWDMNQWLFIVHNEFFRRAAETGILGGLSFIALLWTGCRVALRLSTIEIYSVKLAAIGWFAALVSLIWQMSWVPWTGFTYNAILWLMLGIMDAAERQLYHKHKMQ